MLPVIILAVVSFLLCLALTPLCRDLFLRAGMVDLPDTDRKFHLRAVPRIGGIPIVLSCALAFGLLYWMHDGHGKLSIQHGQILYAVLPAGAFIFIVGLVDDLIGLSPKIKLAGQFGAASLAVIMGVRLSLFHLNPVLGIIASIGWLICCTNAVNLIDGMDGLATGIGLSATLTTLSIALITHHTGLALLTAPLAGALLAFLRYNFNPASVFLGDCGSLTIGFVLGCFGLLWSQNMGTLVGLAAPLMALAIPLADVGLAIGRRFLRNKPIFQGDRGHIHHMVLALGFSTRHATLILYAACVACAGLSVMLSISHRGLRYSIFGLFLLLMAIGVHRLGYIEFSAALRMLFHKHLRRAVSEEIYIEELVRSLEATETVEGCWQIVRTACSDLHFVSARFEVRGRCFYEEFSTMSENPSCGIELKLGETGKLLLTHGLVNVSPHVSMTVLNRLRTQMQECLERLELLTEPEHSMSEVA